MVTLMTKAISEFLLSSIFGDEQDDSFSKDVSLSFHGLSTQCVLVNSTVAN